MPKPRPPRRPPTDPALVARRLREAATALGVALEPAAADRLVAFAAELVRWNARVDLIGPADLDTVAERHLLDALALVPVLRDLRVRRLADLGSGAGLPGLALAIVLPDLEVVSIEPRGRRAAFQRHATRLLGLGRVQVVETRVEPGVLPAGLPADAVVARAVTSLSELLPLARPLVRPGGVILAMCGPSEDPAVAGDAAAALGLVLERTHAYSLAGDVERSGERRTRTVLVFRVS